MTIGTLDRNNPVVGSQAVDGQQELRDLKGAMLDSFTGMRDGTPGTDDVQASTGPQVDSAVSLAGTALQPGADNSALTNGAGYQTAADVDADIAAHEAASDPHAAADYQNSTEVTALSQAVVNVHDNSSAAHAARDWQSGAEVGALINAHDQSAAAHAAAFAAHNTDALAHLNEFAKYQLLAEKGLANGYPELDATGKVPISQLPASGGSMAFGCEIDLSATPTFVNAPAGWTLGYNLGIVTVNFNGNIPAGATAVFVSITHRDPTPINNTRTYTIETMSTTLFSFAQFSPSSETPVAPPIDNASCVVVFI